MNAVALKRIEEEFDRLSFDERLWLMERLAHSLRKKQSPSHNDLEEMANDPDIQRELQKINSEFKSTELDGLSAA